MEIKRDFIFDPSLVLYLPLYELDGASFMSKDSHGHLCTVTGALWRPNGRWFDGVDDKAEIDTPKFDTDQVGTLEAWVYPEATGLTFASHAHPGYASTNNQITFEVATTGRISYDVWISAVHVLEVHTPEDSYVLNGFNHLVFTSDGSLIRIYIDSQVQILTITTGINTGQWFGDVVVAYLFTLGGLRTNLGLIQDFKGIIGELRYYNRALTPLEIQHNYLATKWRYR